VLLLHESGHWIAMRLFHYRNLRMFFIPFFGAAVTGQNWNVPGWKKALVSLAGPVPGIGLGIVLGIAGLVLRQPAFNKAALVLLFLNGLNLLPILPLDGGHVLQDTLFCRNRWLDGAFRILAIFGLAGFGMFLGAKVLPYLAIPMAIALPIVFKLGKVTDDMRRQPLPPPLPGEDRIPVPTAQAIIKTIRESFPAKITLSNKVLAQHTLNVFERLNAKPPGPLATLALLAVHGGALFAALLVAGLLVIAGHGGLGDFFAAAIRQPQHFFRIGDVQTWPAVRQGDDSGVRTLVATTLKNRAAADAAFVELTNRVPPASALTRVGDSLLLSLPADDDGAREHWFDEFQGRSTNTFVALSNSPVAVSLACVAPTKTVVTNVTRELRTYFATASEMHLIAPWSPEAKGADFAGWSLARQQWAGIEREVAGVWRDPSLKSYQAKITAALKRGTLAEAQRLEKEHAQKLKDLQTEARERLRTESPRRFDPVLVDLYSTLNGINWTNREARKAVFRELAGKLGEVPYTGDRPVYGADAYGVDSGTIAPHGLFIELRWVGFRDVTRGLPAMTDWLSNQGCRQFKYELEGSGFLAELDERDD